MDSGVFLLHDDNTLTRMVAQSYVSEALLQRHLEEHPDLLAGDQINPGDPRRWMLVKREMGVPAEMDAGDWWSVDHLFLDQDAIPTFVEVKRASDTRARREVVAQMLDYAANATENWPVDRMREAFARRCADAHLDPASELTNLVGDDVDEQAFWDLAKRNLAEGRIRLLFVGDLIPAPLRRIVEFLNRHLSPTEVLAVEIRQFGPIGATGPRTLVPRVIGQTEQARVAKASPQSTRVAVAIDEETYLAGYSPDVLPLVQMMLRVARAEGFTTETLKNALDEVRVRLAPAGVSGSPLTIDQTWLWISLGRHHPALLEPDVNRRIRDWIRSVDPSRKQVEDLKKREVAVPLRSLLSVPEARIRELFVLFSGVLLPSERHTG